MNLLLQLTLDQDFQNGRPSFEFTTDHFQSNIHKKHVGGKKYGQISLVCFASCQLLWSIFLVAIWVYVRNVLEKGKEKIWTSV